MNRHFPYEFVPAAIAGLFSDSIKILEMGKYLGIFNDSYTLNITARREMTELERLEAKRIAKALLTEQPELIEPAPASVPASTSHDL